MNFEEWYQEHSKEFRKIYVMMGPLGQKSIAEAAWNAATKEAENNTQKRINEVFLKSIENK